MKIDAHVHSPYCPHGTQDPFAAYVEKAIEQGIQIIIFTEHAPLPPSFVDPTPLQDSGMRRDEVASYLRNIEELKKEYGQKIRIEAGFEVDYIAGYEAETLAFLQEVEEYVKNSILSVHMLPLPNGRFLCLDYSEAMFGQLVEEYGSVDAVYRLYLQQLLSITRKPFGKWTPPRIGHLNLIQKFEQAYPTEEFCFTEWFPVLDAIRSAGFILDLNTAGIDKPLYGKTYPSPELIEEAVKRGIPFVSGSDSHQADTVGRHFSNVKKQLPSQIILFG